jgi:hypothetical protein
MTPYILMDELHVQVQVRRDSPDRELAALRRFLSNRRFQQNFVGAVKSLFKSNPALPRVRVKFVR